MGLTFNGTEPDTVKFNGADVESVSVNGTEVWSGTKTLKSVACGNINSARLFTKNYIVFAPTHDPTTIDIFDRRNKTFISKTPVDFDYHERPVSGVLNNAFSFEGYNVCVYADSTEQAVVLRVLKLDESTLTESLYDTVIIPNSSTALSSNQNKVQRFKNTNKFIISVVSSSNLFFHYYVYDADNKTLTEITVTGVDQTLPVYFNLTKSFLNGDNYFFIRPNAGNTYVEVLSWSPAPVQDNQHAMAHVTLDEVNHVLAFSDITYVDNINNYPADVNYNKGLLINPFSGDTIYYDCYVTDQTMLATGLSFEVSGTAINTTAQQIIAKPPIANPYSRGAIENRGEIAYRIQTNNSPNEYYLLYF